MCGGSHCPYATHELCALKLKKNVGKLFSGAFFLGLCLSFSATGESSFPTSFLFSSEEVEG